MAEMLANRVAAIALVVILGGCTAASPGTQQSGTPEPTSEISTPVSGPAQTPQLSAADYAAMERRIERLLDTGGPAAEHIEAVLVSVGDETQVAVYRNRKPADYAHVYSVTKSVLSILVGIAIDESRLRLDQTLGEALPAYRDRMSEEVAGVTIQQVITMTAGFSSNEADTFLLANPDIVGQILSFGLATAPGESFNYSNEGAHLLGAVLAEAVGQTPLEYARAKLFDPMGIESQPAYEGSDYFAPEFYAANFAWAADGSGLNSGCCGLKLTAEDMLKIGQLYRAEGRWDGRQLVSADWVHASTAPQVVVDSERSYGYFWWLAGVDGLRGFIASGAWSEGSAGQLIVVVPDRDLVAVMSCSDSDETPKCWDAGWNLIWELVVAPLR